jgi:hypothetical protein
MPPGWNDQSRLPDSLYWDQYEGIVPPFSKSVVQGKVDINVSNVVAFPVAPEEYWLEESYYQSL